MADENLQVVVEGLATLLVLEDEVRKLNTIKEFSFFVTNETHKLIPYHSAVLWQKKMIGAEVIAQSGSAEIDTHAPINQALKVLINKMLTLEPAKDIYKAECSELVDTKHLSETPPENILWCPFVDKHNEITGGLIFFREAEFVEAEIKMLRWLISSYQYTWEILFPSKKASWWNSYKKKSWYRVYIAVLLVVLFFPVHLTVLGNGTVDPKDPTLINAPIQGVIKSFEVKPGDSVKAGQLLFVMDKTDLQATVDVTQKDLSLTQTKLRTAVNQSFDDPKSQADIPILRAQLDIDQARLNYTNELLNKTNVVTPVDGVVIFNSKEDWIGQPVQTGERILVVANPDNVELKITVPVTDIIKLKIGNEGSFFPYGRFSSMPVQLRTLGYNARLTPSRILAYELNADFENQSDNPQLGTQGAVKLYGQRVPFIYYLLRRPIQVIRQKIGM